MSDRLAPLRDLPRIKVEPRAPRLRRIPVVHGLGPEFAGLRDPAIRVVWPGKPPPGFVTATTSMSEWFAYAALAKVMGDPPDERRAPFFGGRDWDYQRTIDPTGTRFAILDFIVYLPRQRIGIRVVSRYFHISQGPEQKMFDRTQRVRLEGQGFRVQDIYEEDFAFGPEDSRTGPASMAVVKEALGLRERLEPIASARSIAKG